ncbi:MAG: hypothetical protein AAF581_02500 [Planctomycetota bacterium]
MRAYLMTTTLVTVTLLLTFLVSGCGAVQQRQHGAAAASDSTITVTTAVVDPDPHAGRDRWLEVYEVEDVLRSVRCFRCPGPVPSVRHK